MCCYKSICPYAISTEIVFTGPHVFIFRMKNIIVDAVRLASDSTGGEFCRLLLIFENSLDPD